VLRRVPLLAVLAFSGVLFGATPALGQSILKLSSGQQIQPTQPVLTQSPAQLEFGEVDIHSGGTPKQSVVFTSPSQSPVTISAVTISEQGSSSFQIANDGCLGQTIESGSCTVEVSFDPGTPVAKSATLEILTEEEETFEVPLSGEGITGTLSASSSPLEFSAIPYTGSGSHGEGSQNETDEIKISDEAKATADIESVSITGPDASSYSEQWGNCEHDYMQANNYCTMGIRFEPVALGANDAQLVIKSDASDSPLVIQLEGEGLHGPQISMSSRQALLGEVPIGSSAWQTFTLTNTGDYPLGVQQAVLLSGTPLMFPVISDGCSEQEVKPNASCAMTVGFQPTTPGEKDASILFITSSSLPLTVVGIDGVGVQPAASPQAVLPGSPSPVAPGGQTPSVLPANQAPAFPHPSGGMPQWLTLNSPAHILGVGGEEAIETGTGAQCPAAYGVCEVESFVTARIPARVPGRGSVSVARATVLLGASTTTLQGGASAHVRVPLLGRAIMLLKDHGQIRATIGFVVRADGTTVSAHTRSVTLTNPGVTAAQVARDGRSFKRAR
jgi:HYDIN/CFA65/VesB family protein